MSNSVGNRLNALERRAAVVAHAQQFDMSRLSIEQLRRLRDLQLRISKRPDGSTDLSDLSDDELIEIERMSAIAAIH